MTLYESYFNKQDANETISLIIILIVLIVQFLITLIFLIKGYKKYKQYIVIKQQELKQILLKEQQQQKQFNSEQKRKDKSQILTVKHISLIDIILYSQPNRILLLVFFILILLTIFLCSSMFIMNLFAIQQAVQYNYNDSQVLLKNKIEQFVKGNQKWIGLQKIVPNITALNLVLNTRLQVSINAIKGLLLNGTVYANGTAIPNANRITSIGFANNTNITSRITQNPLLNQITITTNVSSFMTAYLRQWLFRNSSLSGNVTFPVCQNNVTYKIQHPIIATQQIQLNYMNSICQKLTKQTDQLIQNGKKVDELLIHLQNVISTRSIIQSNLSSLNSIYLSPSIRSNQYLTYFSSMGLNYLNTISIFPILILVIYIVFGFLLAFFIMICYFKQFCHCCKIQCNCDCDQDKQSSEQNYIINHKQQQQKYSEISLKYSRIFLIFFILINTLVGVSLYLYTNSLNQTKKFCYNFKKSQQKSFNFREIGLDSFQSELLVPIQKCISSQNDYFMQNIPLLTARVTLEKLYIISNFFNLSRPKNIYISQSLNQIQIIKDYLFHLQKIPIKSTSFDLKSALKQLNLYSNGSNLKSEQVKQCNIAVIQDQYVYNSVDCHNKIMNVSSEFLITQPRCIIIPTYNGTPGTNTTRLNSVPHTFQLNTTCTSINQMFNPLNSNCFLSKRLKILNDSKCVKTSIQLGKRLQNLIKFSLKASSFTDIYIQNVRNFFGAYAILSTNLTQFFAGSKMAQTFADFGTLSQNLLNRTNCQQIKNNFQELINSYCPDSNNISILLYDTTQWSLIAFITILFQSILFYFSDLIFRIYRVNRWFQKICHKNKQKIRKNSDDFQRKNLLNNKYIKNRIQISQQTLIREEETYKNYDKFRQHNDQFNHEKQLNQNLFDQKAYQTKTSNKQQQIKNYFDPIKKDNQDLYYKKQQKLKKYFEQHSDQQKTSKKLYNINLDEQQFENNKKNNIKENKQFIFQQNGNKIGQYKQLKKSTTTKNIHKRLNYKVFDEGIKRPNIYNIQYNQFDNFQFKNDKPQNKNQDQKKLKLKNYLSIDLIKDDVKKQNQIQKLNLTNVKQSSNENEKIKSAR